jgi:hypothetical protein
MEPIALEAFHFMPYSSAPAQMDLDAAPVDVLDGVALSLEAGGSSPFSNTGVHARNPTAPTGAAVAASLYDIELDPNIDSPSVSSALMGGSLDGSGGAHDVEEQRRSWQEAAMMDSSTDAPDDGDDDDNNDNDAMDHAASST